MLNNQKIIGIERLPEGYKVFGQWYDGGIRMSCAP